MRLPRRSLALLLVPACMPLYGLYTKYDFGAVEPTPKSGAWQRVDAADAPSPPQVYAQTGRGNSEQFNLALLERVAVKDLDLRVQLRAGAGRIDQGGGLVWHAKDERNYYLARWNPLESNLRAYQVVGGVRTELASAEVEAGPGWHTLRVWTRRNKIEVFFDGKSRFEFVNDTFVQPGMVGLWTKADAETQFDDLEIQEL